MKPSPNLYVGKRLQTPWHMALPSCLFVLMCLGGAGCKPEAKVAAGTESSLAKAADINPVGNFTLVSVNGNKVPCALNHEGHTMDVKSGSFTINADGSCSSKISLAGRDAPIEVKATYTREGHTLTMKWQGAGMTTGTLEGETFTMVNEGIVFAYQK